MTEMKFRSASYNIRKNIVFDRRRGYGRKGYKGGQFHRTVCVAQVTTKHLTVGVRSTGWQIFNIAV